MKRFAALLALLFLPAISSAQEASTLFGNGIDHGGYGGATAKVTTMNGEAAIMLGAEATWIVGGTGYVGAAGQSVFNRVESAALQSDGRPYLLWVNEAGIRGGYIHHGDDLLHLSAGALVGLGSIQLADRYPWRDPKEVRTLRDEEEYYYIVEPELAAQLNVLPFMRMKVAGSYRIAMGVDSPGATNADLSGPAGSLTLMFGSF